MEYKNITQLHACILEAALLACNSVKHLGSFRARDLRLFIDLFSNWTNVDQTTLEQPISNTHIGRYLNSLIKLGYARKHKRNGKQRFAMRSSGIIKATKDLTSRDYCNNPEQCLFVFLFLDTYLLPELLIQKRIGLTSQQLVSTLLAIASSKLFIETQLYFIRQKKSQLIKQIQTIQSLDVSKSEIDLNTSHVSDILEYIDADCSFFMHSDMPAEKFFSERDLNRLVFEINTGAQKRKQILFQNALLRLEFFEKQLLSL